MKKLFLTLLIGASSASFAQEGNNESSESLKFNTGDKSFELLVAPFKDNPISLNQIKFRYFNSANTALRLSGNLSQTSTNTVIQQEIDSISQPELMSDSLYFEQLKSRQKLFNF